MEWTDIRLTVSKTDAEAAEAVATMIAEGGIYIEDYSDIEEQVEQIAHVDLIEQELLDKPRDTVIIHMYLEPGASPVETLALIAARMEAAGIPYTSETEGVEQEDWQNGWRKYYHPMDVGQRLAIVPSWQDYDTDRVKLILDPGLAFGTGGHETTSLCLEVLDERVKGGERVLDIGTGSGILAIAALKLGAAVAEGVDIDPVAVRTAGENAALNGVADKLTVLVGDLSDKASGKYDIITANIVANAIMSLAPAVPGLMADDAVFIASGIIDSRKDEVFNEINMIVKSNAIGIPLLAVIQGIVAVIGYFIFQTPDPLLFGFLTCIATIIPIVGTALVWVPLAAYMALNGDWVHALGLAIYALLVITNVDNLIRFILQKKLADIHPLITVFGVVIGLSLFGFMGIIFGPLLLSLFLLCIDIFKKSYLDK